jgi:hypothetical protein
MAKPQPKKPFKKFFSPTTVSFLFGAVVIFTITFLGAYNYGASQAARPPQGGGGGGSTSSYTMSVSPASGKYAPGVALPVTIMANSGTEGVNAVQAKINYDTTHLDLVSVEETGSFNIDAGTDTTSTPGVVRIARGSNNTPLTGSFPVVKLNFVTKAAGSGGALVAIDTANSYLVSATTSLNILTSTSSATFTVRGR